MAERPVFGPETSGGAGSRAAASGAPFATSGVMRAVRLHPDGPIDPPSGGEPSNRLNLLLSYAGWRENCWADRLPRMLEPLGVRSHRARSAREASDVIRQVPIHIAVVDLGLPLESPQAHAAPSAQEAGVKILEMLHRLATSPPTVVVKRARTARDDRREMAAALRHGAFAVVDRPHAQTELEHMLDVLRRCLSRHYQGRWPD